MSTVNTPTSPDPPYHLPPLHHLEGPKSRSSELWFVFKVLFQFIKGFRALHFTGPCVTIFGSARFGESHPFYAQAREMGRRIAGTGLAVMTGGGPGLMEAANRGAVEGGGLSIGCNVTLPREQAPNPFLHKWVTVRYFLVRKFLLLKYSYGYVVFPGGLGTMDEFFETATLIQTRVVTSFPVVVIGTQYYAPLQRLLEDMVLAGTVSARDLDLLLITDDLQEGLDHITGHLRQNYRPVPYSPLWWLWERRQSIRSKPTKT